MKIKQSSLHFFLLMLIFITASFDIALQFKVFEFTIRLPYVLALILIFFYFPRKLRFLGLYYFLVWTFFLSIFLFNTSLVSRNIGYLLWHSLHFFLIISIAQVANDDRKFMILFRLYLYSFAFIAYLGLFQFFLGVFGVDFYVEQWWIENRLPRVNGFSYEPSYYATYLIIGWTIFFFFVVQRTYLLPKHLTKHFLFILTLALVLSSSRLGIFFMASVVMAFSLWISVKSVFTLVVLRKHIYFLCFSLFLFLCTLAYVVPMIVSKYSFLLNGTGLAGQASHSTVRFETMSDMIGIILNNPFEGTSLGGIPSAIAKYKGFEITSVAEAKNFEGINVFLEVFIASGLIGFFFFILYLVKIIMSSFAILNNKVFDIQTKSISNALIISFLVELAILCFNQNILRIYLWLHIAMINAFYFTCVKKAKSSNGTI